jgi:RimJ/RimL family protein N-acetyltransferase
MKRLLNLADRIRIYRRRHGSVATMRFLGSRIVRHQRHVVFEAILDRAPDDVAWLEGERLKVIDRENIDSAIGAELRAFLGGDGALENLEGVRNGDELFVVAKEGEYHHCGYILFRTPQTRIIGEPQDPPLIACCLTAPAARGRGLYRRALIAELRHLWNRGYRRVVIETSPENLPSRKGIEAAGFRLCREVSAWIVLNWLVYQTQVEPAGATRRLILI